VIIPAVEAGLQRGTLVICRGSRVGCPFEIPQAIRPFDCAQVRLCHYSTKAIATVLPLLID
jgi:hypothetical protein